MVKIFFFIAIIAIAFAVSSGLVLAPGLSSGIPIRPVLRDVGGETPANTVKGEYVHDKIITGLKYEYEPTVITNYIAPRVVGYAGYPAPYYTHAYRIVY